MLALKTSDVFFFFQVKSFRSYCGGLPAPEHADNPLRYKFRYYAYSLIKYQFVSVMLIYDLISYYANRGWPNKAALSVFSVFASFGRFLPSGWSIESCACAFFG